MAEIKGLEQLLDGFRATVREERPKPRPATPAEVRDFLAPMSYRDGSVAHFKDMVLAFIVIDNDGNELLTEIPFDSRRFERAVDEDGDPKHIDDES